MAVIQLDDGFPDDIEAAYAGASNGDTIRFPAGSNTYDWSGFSGFVFDGPAVHLEGAAFTPTSDYRTADPNDINEINAALDGFEPLTIIQGLTGGDIEMLLVTVPDCIISKLWFQSSLARGDTAIHIEEWDGTVVYYCRFTSMGGGPIRSGSFGTDVEPANGLLTDNVYHHTDAAEAAVVLWRDQTNGVYEATDVEDYLGQFNMPYVQRSLFVDVAHAVDFTRNGIGAARDNIGHGTINASYGHYRFHGKYESGGATQQSGRFGQIERCRYAADGDAASWVFVHVAGGDALIHDCDANDNGTGFAQINLEAISRGDITCGAATYPQPQQPLNVYMGGCMYNGGAVDAVADINFNQCGEPDELYIEDRNFFFDYWPDFVSPGTHPLFPAEISGAEPEPPAVQGAAAMMGL